MSLKTGFATVLKAIRTSRGLTHKNMSGASSRGYMLAGTWAFKPYRRQADSHQ